ncbi:MAG: hypothetical protein ACRDBY_14050 [Cetobacterium sp.]
MKLINDKMYFSRKEVADLVGRSVLTIHHWDKWSDEREAQGLNRFIPSSIRVGTYRFWNEDDIKAIKEFAEYVRSNKGVLSEYSKRCWGTKIKESSK